MQIKIPGIVSINHIMWQPFLNCTKRCKGCYVQLAGEQEQQAEVSDEILQLLKQDKVRCEQFTISLNSFVVADSKIEELAAMLRHFWQWCESFPNQPDICLTVHDATALLKWQVVMKLQPAKFWRPVAMLSVSHMPSLGKKAMALKETCEKHGVELNYNKLVNKIHIDKATEIGCRYAHQTYLVMHKAPLGEKQNIEHVTNWLNHLVPVSGQTEQMYPDICCEASKAFNNSGEMCSAGIDKVHVWPSGRVTACPYDSHNVCGKKSEKYNTWEELEAISYGDRPHPMTKCSIPQVLEQIGKNYKEINKMVAPQEEQR